MEIQVMKIGNYIKPTQDAFDKFPFWKEDLIIQEKIDGCFCFAIKDKSGNFMLSFNGKDPKTHAQLNATRSALSEWMPNDTIIVGELGFASEVETKRAAQYGYHRFVCFDILRWEGKEYSHKETIDRYWELVFRHEFCPNKDIVQLVKTMTTGGDMPSRAFRFFTNIVLSDGEGIIIKRPHVRWSGGTRTSDYYKVKAYFSREYIIMDFEETTAPTYLAKGLKVAAIKAGAYVNGKLKQLTTASGFSDDWRREFTENPEQYIGEVVEIGGNKIFESGAMRHPHFVKLRPEINKYDCTIENVKRYGI